MSSLRMDAYGKVRIWKMLFPAVCALSYLAACARGADGAADGRGEEREGAEYVYVAEYDVVETGAEEYLLQGASRVAGDMLYYPCTEHQADHNEARRYVCALSLTGEHGVTKTLVGGGTMGGGSTNAFCVSEEGNLYVISCTNTDFDGNYRQKFWELAVYDAQGNALWRVDLSDTVGTDGVVRNMEVDGEGRLYLMMDDRVCLLDGEGVPRGDWRPDGARLEGIGVGRDGKVYVLYTERNPGEAFNVLAELDYDKRGIGSIYRNFPSGNNCHLVSGKDYDFVTTSGGRVYGYDMATQAYEEVFSWLDYGVDGHDADGLGVAGDGRVVTRVLSASMQRQEIIQLIRTDKSLVPERTRIVIGALSTYQDGKLGAAVADYNRRGGNCQVTVKTYLDPNMEWTRETYRDAVTALYNDILSDDECPDVILLDGIDVEPLATKGAFVDLRTFLSQSDVLEEEDFWEHVLTAYEYEGCLVGIPRAVSLETLAGRTAELGAESGWTMERMYDYAKGYPDATLLDYADKGKVLSLCLSLTMDSFLDGEEGSCDFDSDAFKKVLKFVDGFPQSYQGELNNTFEKLREHDVLLYEASIADLADIQLYGPLFGEDVTYIGYPTSDGGNGCIMCAMGVYAISSKSREKQAAWSFVEYYLDREWLRRELWGKGEGLPARKSVMDGLIASFPETAPSCTFRESNFEYRFHEPTQEEIALTIALMEDARPESAVDDTVLGIIREEAEAFFAGQKSADEVARIIQNRVLLYVEEKN